MAVLVVLGGVLIAGAAVFLLDEREALPGYISEQEEDLGVQVDEPPYLRPVLGPVPAELATAERVSPRSSFEAPWHKWSTWQPGCVDLVIQFEAAAGARRPMTLRFVDGAETYERILVAEGSSWVANHCVKEGLRIHVVEDGRPEHVLEGALEPCEEEARLVLDVPTAGALTARFACIEVVPSPPGYAMPAPMDLESWRPQGCKEAAVALHFDGRDARSMRVDLLLAEGLLASDRVQVEAWDLSVENQYPYLPPVCVSGPLLRVLLVE